MRGCCSVSGCRSRRPICALGWRSCWGAEGAVRVLDVARSRVRCGFGGRGNCVASSGFGLYMRPKIGGKRFAVFHPTIEASEAVKTTKAPESAFVLSAIRRVPVSSEFIAEADHVDEGIYVDIDFDFAELRMVGGSLSVNIDIPNLGVEHQCVG